MLVFRNYFGWQIVLEKPYSTCQNKVSKAIGILYRAREKLNDKHLITLYYSLIYPYLTYCNSVWSNTTQEFLKPLEKVHKAAVRCICFLRTHGGTAQYFKKLELMKLEEIKKYNICLFMYKFHHKMLPNIFSYFFEYNRDVHAHNTMSIVAFA